MRAIYWSYLCVCDISLWMLVQLSAICPFIVQHTHCSLFASLLCLLLLLLLVERTKEMRSAIFTWFCAIFHFYRCKPTRIPRSASLRQGPSSSLSMIKRINFWIHWIIQTFFCLLLRIWRRARLVHVTHHQHLQMDFVVCEPNESLAFSFSSFRAFIDGWSKRYRAQTEQKKKHTRQAQTELKESVCAQAETVTHEWRKLCFFPTNCSLCVCYGLNVDPSMSIHSCTRNERIGSNKMNECT